MTLLIAALGKVMKRGQQNVIEPFSVTCIITAGLSKLKDLQLDRESAAGNKYQTVYKY